jgi:hypothetical protein
MDLIENKLKAILFRNDCPSKIDLGENELGFLSSQRREEIASHMAVCPLCPADLVQMRQFMALPTLSIGSVQSEGEQKLPLLDRVRVIVVDLLSPSAGMLGPASLQTVLRGAENNMHTTVIKADAYVISISALEDNTSLPKRQFIGDIIPLSGDNETFHNWTATLWRSGTLVASTQVADDNHFMFEDVQLMEKPHELILSGPTVEIHLQNLQIA